MFRKQKPLGFRKWVTLENLKKQLSEAVEGSDFPDVAITYLSTAFGNKKWENKFWKTSVYSMLEGFRELNPNLPLPILNAPNKGKESDWEYESRSWFYFSHIIASAYGWSLEYIANLDANEALAHIQEILTDEHLDREFEYSLSEVAYVYDKGSKKYNFKPMPRPYWMKPLAPKKPKIVKFRKDMMPVGVIQDVSGMPNEFNPLRNEKTNTSKDSPTLSPPS